MAEHAALTKPLTPRLLAVEAAKLPPEVRVVALHIKPLYRSEAAAELTALEGDRVSIVSVDPPNLI